MKSNEFQATFNQYMSWQKLPARDALGDVASLQSRLRSISDFTPSARAAPSGLRFSFELPCSDVLTSIGQLGRIHIGQRQGSASCADTVDYVDRGPAGKDDMDTSQEKSLVASLSTTSDSSQPPRKKPRK